MDGLLLDFAQLEPFQRWSILAAAAATIVYAVMRPWRRKKDPLARSATPVSLAGQRDLEKQMTELLVELEQMARQMTAQLDTRAARLEMLIREADEKINELRAGGAARSESAPRPRLPSGDIPPLPDPRHAEVYRLADQDLSTSQIARQLGRPYGEIELILALRGPGAVNDVAVQG
jgi:hypothetical protein